MIDSTMRPSIVKLGAATSVLLSAGLLFRRFLRHVSLATGFAAVDAVEAGDPGEPLVVVRDK